MITREEFDSILKLEITARNHYDNILSQTTDQTVRRNIEIIRDDEIRHIKIAEKMIKIISEG